MSTCALLSDLGKSPEKSDGRTWDPTRSQPRQVLEYTSLPGETELTRHCPGAPGASRTAMSGANGLGSTCCSCHICSADPALFSHPASPEDHPYPSSSLGHTSIKAAGHGVSLAGGTFKEGCRPVDEGTGLAGLCLGPPTVPELGAHHQKALGWGLWGHQPRTEWWG